jgi:predicted small metal-binding protein
MKQFACKDMDMDCDFVASGETVEEVTQLAFEHAQAAHGEVLAQMGATPEGMQQLTSMVVSKIH